MSKFKKAIRALPSLSRKQRVRAIKIASKLDEDRREDFLEELEDKETEARKKAFQISCFIEDFGDYLKKAERVVKKMKTEDEEAEEKEVELAQAEEHLSKFSDT